MRISPNKHFEDELVSVYRPYRNPLYDHSSLTDMLLECEKLQITIKYKHYFFEQIVKNFHECKWVDVEYEYYLALLQIYKWNEKQEIIRGDYFNQDIIDLNSCFESIKKKLAEYLSDQVKIKNDCKNNNIDDILFEGAFNEKGKRYEIERLFICFNYTSTMQLYLGDTIFKNDIIYIHGELNDIDNPIIFGYGDEMDPHYEKIENLNNNEFLKNIKSFNYFKTVNYQRVVRFVESGDFTVKILGHSCGLSDRILLNTIFEHENCKAIKIYHYEKSPNENDYFEKTQEISRQFKASKKGEMRLKIVPFDKYSAMPQNPKGN